MFDIFPYIRSPSTGVCHASPGRKGFRTCVRVAAVSRFSEEHPTIFSFPTSPTHFSYTQKRELRWEIEKWANFILLYTSVYNYVFTFSPQGDGRNVKGSGTTGCVITGKLLSLKGEFRGITPRLSICHTYRRYTQGSYLRWQTWWETPSSFHNTRDGVNHSWNLVNFSMAVVSHDASYSDDGTD